jgi:Putative metal-binding motif
MRRFVLLAGLAGCADTVTPDPTTDSPTSDTETPTSDTTSPPPAPVDADEDGFVSADDCDDDDPTAFPGAAERCDGRDQDCDGAADNGFATAAWHLDADGDGYGAGPAFVTCLPAPERYVADATDCDDARSDAHPGAYEIECNGADEDCDGLDPAGDHYVPDEYETIQAAVTAASSGDTICVDDGDYTGIFPVNKSVDIVGTGSAARLSTGNGSRVYVAQSGNQRLVNLVLDGRDVEPLIQVSPGATMELVDVTAEDVGCSGFCLGLVAFQYENAALTVRRLTLNDSTVGAPYGIGGLFYANNQPITIEDTHIAGVTLTSGGPFLVHAAEGATLKNVSITGFQGDVAEDVSLLGFLGGTLVDVYVGDNTITSASAVQAVDGWSDIEAVRFGFVRNTFAAPSRVGAIHTYDPLTLENALFAGNSLTSPADAAPVHAHDSLVAAQVTFADNVGSGSPYADLWVDGAATLTNTIVAASGADAALLLGGDLTASRVVAWGTEPLSMDPALASVPWTGLSFDPLFAGAPEGFGYTLSDDSPAVDAGEGLDFDGTPADLGAFGGPRAVVPGPL